MNVKKQGEITIVSIVERFDANVAKDVEQEFKNILGSGVNKLVCDFSGTDYISSAGLRVILSIAKALEKSGGKVALCSLKPYVKEVFDMAGFSQILKIFATQEEALKLF